MTRKTRPISWVKAARKDFEGFPPGAQTACLTALIIAAEGAKADIVKPLTGFGAGLFEIALPYRGDAFRVIYAGPDRRRPMGASCIPKEVKAWHQNAET